MTHTFLVDAQLPPALARWLIGRGHRAIHVIEMGLGAATDLDIWREAAAQSAIIVSKDSDFLTLAVLRTRDPVRVLHLGIGNTASSALIEQVSRVWNDVEVWLATDEQTASIRGR